MIGKVKLHERRDFFKEATNDLLGKGYKGSLRTHLTRSTAGTFALKVASTGLGFLTALILARLLGAAGYGSYAYAMAWVGLLGLPATLGFHQLLVRNVAVYQTQEKWGLLHGLLHFSNRLVLITSMILMAGAALVGWVLLSSKNDNSMLHSFWIALLALPFLALTQLRQDTMRGFQRIIRGQLPEMLIRRLLFLVSVAGVYFLFRQHVSAPLVMVVNVATAIIAYGIGAYWLQKAVPNKAKILEPQFEVRAWVSSAVPFLLIGSFQQINSRTDIVMLGIMKTTSEVGIYKLASQIAWLITMVLMSVNTFLAPSIASLWASKNLALLQRIISRSAQLTFAISLSIWIVLVILGK